MELDLQSRLRVDRIKEMRERQGFSQRQLARMCGFSIHQVHRYENGMTEPSATALATLAEKLNVSTDYLLGLSDFPQSYAPESLRTDETRLLEAYAIGDSSTLIELMSERLKLLANQKKTD